MAAGSLWVGGLIGLLVLWRSLPVARRVAGLAVCVPRFSNVAFVSVLALIGSGIGASLLHLPTLASLWKTSYGQALLVKIALLCGGAAARCGQPAAHAAAPAGLRASGPSSGRRRRGSCAGSSAARSRSSPAPCSPRRC